ncbi:MAG: hypothetical protein HY350_04765 [Candidatus Omnitrophica bacterium]|nr:hypothetical protein [Candidatus Omnitrophota bacterium]
MTFKSQMAVDAINSFLNTDEFGETIAYTPKDGVAKSIKALIIRNRLDRGIEDSGRILHNQAEIYIANDATTGITSVNKGFDEVSFPEIIGGSSISWSVIDILSMDDGLWRLLVEK